MGEKKEFQWDIPEGGLLGRPLLGQYKLTLKAVEAGTPGTWPVRDVLKTSQASDPYLSFQSDLDGQWREIPVPDGSLKAYFEKRPEEFGKPDAYVLMEYEYEPAPGEDITVSKDRIPDEVRKAALEAYRLNTSSK